MSVSSINSGYQLIQKSQNLSQEAASELSSAAGSNALSFNKVDTTETENEIKEPPKQSSLEEPLLKLQLAKTYSQTGSNMVQRSNDIIGTILDTHV